MIYTAEQDPLCYPGTTILINRADLRDQHQLDQFELAMFLSRAEEPWPPGIVDETFYCRLHRHFFQDVYAWAGQVRTIRTGKGANWFCYPEYIDRELRRAFQWLGDAGQLKGREPVEFSRGAAHLLGDINAIHPFREGNGRTQMALLTLLAEEAGLPFNDDVLDPQPVIAAMVASFSGDELPLKELILKVVSA